MKSPAMQKNVPFHRFFLRNMYIFTHKMVLFSHQQAYKFHAGSIYSYKTYSIRQAVSYLNWNHINVSKTALDVFLPQILFYLNASIS